MLLTLTADGTPLCYDNEEGEEITMITICHDGNFQEDSKSSRRASADLPCQDPSPVVIRTSVDNGSEVNAFKDKEDYGSPVSSLHQQSAAPRVVVVGVCWESSSCRDTIRWAVANKISGLWDSLILLHVVSKIPQSCIAARRSRARPGEGLSLVQDVELFQSEVPPHALKHYIKGTVEPMLEEVKATLPLQVNVKLHVGKNNSIPAGILDEARKLKAATLVLGAAAPSKGILPRFSKASRTGAYCLKQGQAQGMSVYIIQNRSVVLKEEIHGSPSSSGSSSPGHSLGTPPLSGHSPSLSPSLDSSPGLHASSSVITYSEEEIQRKFPRSHSPLLVRHASGAGQVGHRLLAAALAASRTARGRGEEAGTSSCSNSSVDKPSQRDLGVSKSG